MMNSASDTKQEISDCLKNFSKGSLLHNATELLRVLGYESDKTVLLSPNTVAEFQENFGNLHPEKAIVEDWKSVDMVFQLTDDEIAMAGRSQPGLFASENWMDKGIIKSFIFLAVELSEEKYTRTQLATITREINKLFPMPVIILFRHGATLTLSVIDRRQNKKDQNRDVLEKITLIKDIRIESPHRAHMEILFDLSIEHLKSTFAIATFDELYNAWRKTLSASELNKRFYQELSNWYFWALGEVDFPEQEGIPDKENRATNVIRLITRLIFVWFMKEKSLLPDAIFNEQKLRHDILKSLEPDESTFYQAILQNLFFATLNTEMDNAARPRKFRGEGAGNSRDQNYMVHSVYRHKVDFRNADEALQLFATIPFLNGGLFECLDKRVKRDGKEVEIRIDGFSDKPQKSSSVPNKVFFGEDHDIDLNEELGTKNKKYKVRGLIDILHSYKFTVDENTPIEEEIALDPELLGKVFENLLASYNPETGVAARKQTGSFYTPREIVGYMVDESLLAYFQNYLEASKVLSTKTAKTLPENLRHLLAYNEEEPQFTENETTALIKAASEVKILDPACGSGAFPMGILHKLVFVLSKLDPGNIGWKEQQLARAERDLQRANSMEDEDIRTKAVEEAKHRINEIQESFDNPNHEIDYLRKLYLIEHCIYGVDIQPIAMQISKLRFFISLVIDQKINDNAKNRGIRPLPNLETKLVAANTLLAIAKPAPNKQFTLRNPEIDAKEAELKIVRERYFLARTPKTKEKYREEDKRLRDELGALLLADGFLPEITEKLAHWDPYDQKASAEFFDAEWMFGVKDGFDIVIGNPPYVRADGQNLDSRAAIMKQPYFETLWEKWDLYVAFIEFGYKALRVGGVTTMIVADAFCHAKYAIKPQKWYLENAIVRRIDFLSEIKVFEAGVFNVVYFFQKPTEKIEALNNVPERHQHVENFGQIQKLATKTQSDFDHRAFFPEDSKPAIFNGATQKLGDICYISVGMVANAHEVLAPRAFKLTDLLSPIKDKKHPKAFVEAKDLSRWFLRRHKYFEWGTERSPSLLRRQTFEELYEQDEKLMLTMVGEPRAAIDRDRYFCNHGIFVCIRWTQLQGISNASINKSAKYRAVKGAMPPYREELEKISSTYSNSYLLGVINSSSAWHFLHNNRRNNVQFYPDDWKKLPIPTATPDQQKVLSDKVDQILTAKAADPTADISELEREIDESVAELYGLTSDVKKMIGLELVD